MSRSAGPGYPIFFRCRELASIWPRTSYDEKRHQTKLTGKVKPTPFNGKGNPRKSWLTFQYECTCGHVGWSSHSDLQFQAIQEGIIQADDPRLRLPGVPRP